MTKARKVAWIVVGLVVVGAAGTAIALYINQNRPEKVLVRAKLAAKANNFDKATALVDDYIARCPQDWQGYAVRARIFMKQGQFEDARAPLTEARRLRPADADLAIAMSETYTNAAMKALGSLGNVDNARRMEALRATATGLNKANEILSAFKGADPNGNLDVDEQIAMNEYRIGRSLQAISSVLAKDAAIAEAARDSRQAASKRERSLYERNQAGKSFDKAIDQLLDVVLKDPSRDEPAGTLVSLCMEYRDPNSFSDPDATTLAMAAKASAALGRARKAILDPNNHTPPPNASIMLAMDDLESCRGKELDKIAPIAKRLDVIIAGNPDNIRAKLARARVAIVVGDLETAERLAEAVIKARPQDPEAGLLHAKLLLAKGNKFHDPNDPKAKELFERAEKDLYGLRSRLQPGNPWYAQVCYIYADAAKKAKKTELANEALRVAAGLGVLDAQKSFARRLLNQGFARQAFTYADPCYQQHPDDPEALELFVQTARLTDQNVPASNALTNAWKGKPDKDGKPDKSWRGYASGPIMLIVVAKGFLSLGMSTEAGAVLDDLIERAKASPPKTGQEALAVAQGFLLKQRHVEAEELLNSMMAKTPDNPQVCFELARIYGATNREMQAEELCRRAIALNGREPSYRLALASMLVDIGELAEALDVLAPIVSGSIPARLLQLRINSLRGQQIDAEAWALLQQPQAGKQYGALVAQIYLAANNPKKCADICLAGLKANPNDAALLGTLASAYHSLGDDANSVRTWKEAIKAQPQSLPAYQQLAELLIKHAVGHLQLVELLIKYAVGDSTTRPAQTIRLSPQQVDLAVTLARGKLADIAGARQDLVDLAIAGLYEKAGFMQRSAESFAKVAANPAALPYVKYKAQLSQASAMARAGKSKEALGLLDAMIAANKGQARTRVMFNKAVLLAGANDNARAAETLDELCRQAREYNDPDTLRQAADLQARLGLIDQALANCKEVQKLCPDDPRGYMLQADILAGTGRLQQVPELCEKAITLQPNDLRLYARLAGALDALGQPRAALEALEKTEQLGPAGKSVGLLQQGMLLTKWGLQAQAILRFEKLSAALTEPRPDLELALAASFRRLGRAEQAKQALAKISEYSYEYAQGQVMLADLAEGAEAKLKIVRDLASKKPGNESAILYELALLIREKRPAEALKALEGYQASGTHRRPIPSGAAAMAVTAAVQTGDKDSLARIGRELAKMEKSPQWRLAAELLAMDDANSAGKTRPEMSQEAVYPTMLELCRAGMAQDANAASRWADQLTKMNSLLGKVQPPRSIPAAYMFLCGLLAQDQSMTNAAMAKLSAGPTGPAAREMLSAWAGPVKPREETVKLLKAGLARELTLPILARQWAMEALKARPTCQWAAAELARAGPDPTQIEWAADALRPADCRLAKELRANLLFQKEKYKQAAEIYADLARTDGKPDPICMESQAMALEADGQLPEALDIYRQVWQANGSPVSANNAACLVIQLSPKDQARLAEAKQWMDAALKAMPQPALADTAGWIAHLQGRDADALTLLRGAIKGLPDSPEAHCHLGVVELAAGDPGLARWHLEAAVELGDDLKAAGKPISMMTAEAVELARQTLSTLTKNQRVDK